MKVQINSADEIVITCNLEEVNLIRDAVFNRFYDVMRMQPKTDKVESYLNEIRNVNESFKPLIGKVRG